MREREREKMRERERKRERERERIKKINRASVSCGTISGGLM